MAAEIGLPVPAQGPAPTPAEVGGKALLELGVLWNKPRLFV